MKQICCLLAGFPLISSRESGHGGFKLRLIQIFLLMHNHQLPRSATL